MAVKRSRNNIIFQDDITQGLPSNPSSIAPLNAKIVFKDYEKYIKTGTREILLEMENLEEVLSM